MLQAISKQYTKFDDVDFLRWLKIDENLILQHSPPRKEKRKAVSGSFSAISSFMDSEKTNELRNLLLELEAGSEANYCLKQMEKFVYENKSPFSRQGVSKVRSLRSIFARRFRDQRFPQLLLHGPRPDPLQVFARARNPDENIQQDDESACRSFHPRLRGALRRPSRQIHGLRPHC